MFVGPQSPFEPLQPEDDNPANDQNQKQVSALTTKQQQQSLQASIY